MAERAAGNVDPKLLEILVCPLTKGALEYDREKQRYERTGYTIAAGVVEQIERAVRIDREIRLRFARRPIV